MGTLRRSGQPAPGRMGGRHCMAGQYGYVPLGWQHLVYYDVQNEWSPGVIWWHAATDSHSLSQQPDECHQWPRQLHARHEGMFYLHNSQYMSCFIAGVRVVMGYSSIPNLTVALVGIYYYYTWARKYDRFGILRLLHPRPSAIWCQILYAGVDPCLWLRVKFHLNWLISLPKRGKKSPKFCCIFNFVIVLWHRPVL